MYGNYAFGSNYQYTQTYCHTLLYHSNTTLPYKLDVVLLNSLTNK